MMNHGEFDGDTCPPLTSSSLFPPGISLRSETGRSSSCTQLTDWCRYAEMRSGDAQLCGCVLNPKPICLPLCRPRFPHPSTSHPKTNNKAREKIVCKISDFFFSCVKLLCQVCRFQEETFS